MLRLTGVLFARCARGRAGSCGPLAPLRPSVAIGVLGRGTFSPIAARRIAPPGWDYYAIFATGPAASYDIIDSALPLISRITGPEINRNERASAFHLSCARPRPTQATIAE